MDDQRNIFDEIMNLVNSGLVFSDLKLAEGEPIHLKTVNGWVPATECFPTLREDLIPLLNRIDEDWEARITNRSLNKAIDLTSWRLRLNACRFDGGSRIAATIRKIPATVPSLPELGLPHSVKMMIEAPKGLILVTGATGSGKSTTLASMVETINEHKKAHIVTIEDPIEFKFKSRQSIFTQREIGLDVPTFEEGVADAMRQRPDVLVIGEIRNRETAENAMLAADSGVLVIATVHGSSAAGAIQKMLSYFPAYERDAKVESLKNNLVGVIAQILLRRQKVDGWILAAELLVNTTQQFSAFLGNTEQLAKNMHRVREGLSISMADALFDLVKKDLVFKQDAIRAMSGVNQAEFGSRLN